MADNYLVVGAGRMGGALISGWLNDPVSGVTPQNLYIIDPHMGDDAKAAITSGASEITPDDKAMGKIDVVLIGVKPQAFQTIAPTLAPEALEAAAMEAGMPADIAPEFARQTIIGAGALLSESPEAASDLRVAVTSPNGTTQAALDVLMPQLPALMREAVKAALRRAKELAKGG